MARRNSINFQIVAVFRPTSFVYKSAMTKIKNLDDRAPLPCPEMAGIRAEIDRLDSELVILLAARQKQIELAGKTKPSRDTVHDQARIDEVVRLVLSQSEAQGLSKAIAEPLWRHLIQLSIEHEYDIFDER